MADLLLGRTPDDAKTDVTVATDDLVTHGVIVGMTGSGKTGLGVGLIEECLNAGVPTLLIDPKGDLTNLALVFPGLSAAEFEPWVDPAQAKAAGVDTATFAAQQAQLWKEGLAPWGIAEPELAAFKAKFDVAIFTPGSTAGIPLNVLGSLQSPQTSDPEVVADEIEGYVTSLLSVVGINADPLSSREHILLSNIIASAWAAGENIDLPTLLARVNQPPMRKLGVFDIDEFFPPKERTAFAMKLNAVLAAPSFANWITGQPIDIASMLWTPGRHPALRDRHHRAPVGSGPAECHEPGPEQVRHVDAPAERDHRPARVALHGRGRRLPATHGEPAHEEADHAADEAGPRVRRRGGAEHAEPGRCGLQGDQQRGHLADRPADHRERQGPAAGGYVQCRRRCRCEGHLRSDLGAGQAAVPRAQGGPERAGAVRHEVGAVVPARADDPRPDRAGGDEGAGGDGPRNARAGARACACLRRDPGAAHGRRRCRWPTSIRRPPGPRRWERCPPHRPGRGWRRRLSPG